MSSFEVKSVGPDIGQAKISCRNLWKVFGPKPLDVMQRHGFAPSQAVLTDTGNIAAVRGATFEVAEAEIFVIMGLSGSGKSTLVRCLSRLLDATAGEVIFEGQDLQALSRDALTPIRRHKMGMVFQHFALLPHLTVLGNVEFPLEIQGMDSSAREARALEMIELVGLEGREDYYPRELSGGQQQRVGIARSLAGEPDLWFLDEPFSALDPLIRREMQDEFLRLQSVLRKTIVFITHDFDEAIRIADRIAIMNDGEIVQIDTPEDLVLNPATDYVREFTKEIPRAKVLSVGAVMAPLEARANATLAVSVSAKIEDIAAELLDSETGATVVDDDKRPVGHLSQRTVFELLAGRA